MTRLRRLIIILVFVILGVVFGVYQNANNDVIAKTNSYTISEEEVGSYIRYSKLKYESLFGVDEWKALSDTESEKNQLIKNTIDNVVLTNFHEEKNKELGIEPKNLDETKIDPEDKEIKAMLNEYNLKAGFIEKALIGNENDDIYQKYAMEKMKVNEKELKAYYENNKEEFTKFHADMYQIWIKTDKDGKTAKEIADQAYKEIEKGENFESVVQKYSQEKDRSYIGYISEENLLEPVGKVFLKMKNGEISKPIETGEGYFIVKIDNKKKVVEEFKNVKEKIEAEIKENRFYDQEKKYIEKESVKYKNKKFKQLYSSF